MKTLNGKPTLEIWAWLLRQCQQTAWYWIQFFGPLELEQTSSMILGGSREGFFTTYNKTFASLCPKIGSSDLAFEHDDHES